MLLFSFARFDLLVPALDCISLSLSSSLRSWARLDSSLLIFGKASSGFFFLILDTNCLGLFPLSQSIG